MHEIRDVQLLYTSIRNFKLVTILRCILQKPRLSGVSLLFIKCENDRIISHRIHIKLYSQVLDLLEVLTSLDARRSTQTLLVLEFPPLFPRSVPGTERRICVERLGIGTLGRLDDWGDHRNHKVQLEETGPEIMNHIEDKTHNVRPIVIGVSHDHEATIAKLGNTRIFLPLLETQDLLEIVELLVRCELCNRDIPHILTLTAKWEYTIVITTNYRETRDSQSLRRITLGHNEGAFPRLCSSCFVGVIQLGNTRNLGFTSTVRLCKFLHLLKL